MLYELAFGKDAFQRGSAAEIMTAIIREDTEALLAIVPAPFRWIVAYAFQTDGMSSDNEIRDLLIEKL